MPLPLVCASARSTQEADMASTIDMQPPEISRPAIAMKQLPRFFGYAADVA
jgi:hypothetical protein